LEEPAATPAPEPAEPADRVEDGISARLGDAMREGDQEPPAVTADFPVDAAADLTAELADTPTQRASAESPAPAPQAQAQVIEDYPAEVIPPRGEPFMSRRQPEHPDDDFAP